MPKAILRFVLEKETKGALRYTEVDEKDHAKDFTSATIGTLYVRKSALARMGVEGNNADYAVVTISFGDEVHSA